MARSNVSFLWYALVLLSTLWILFNFTTRVLERLVGKLIKAKVHFRFAGFHCLKDVSAHFTMGPLASVFVGEINLKLLIVMLNLSTLRASKLQLRLSKVEICIRRPVKSRPVSGSQRKSHEGKKFPGQSKVFPIISKFAKYLNLTVTEVVVKAPEFPSVLLEVKELGLDTFQTDDASPDSIRISLVVNPINIHVKDMHIGTNDLGYCSEGNPEPIMVQAEYSIIFSLEQLSVNIDVEYINDHGLKIQQIEVHCGEAKVNLSEELLFSDTGFVGSFLSKSKSGRIDQSPVFKDSDGQGAVMNHVSTGKPAGFVGKHLALLPDKFGFSLPQLSFSCHQRGAASAMKTMIKGISIQSCIVRLADQAGDNATRCDIGLDCGEVRILEGSSGSLVQIQRVSVVATVEMHLMVNCRQRVEIDANLEGTQCSLHLDIVDDLLKFCLRIPRKASKQEKVLDKSCPPTKKKKSKSKLCWLCTISAPEIGATAYDSLGITLFRLSSESLQLFVDNVSGPACRMQLEIGEFEAMVVDEVYDDCTASRDGNASSFIHLGGLVMEWGSGDLSSEEENKFARNCSVIIVECSQIGVYLSVIRIQAILTVAMAVMGYVKRTFGHKMKLSPKPVTESRVEMVKALRKIEFGVQGLSIQFCGPEVVDEVDVVDPKTVNFGDQGGKVVITHNPDGVLRTASIQSTGSHLSDTDVLCTVTFEEVFGLISIDNYGKKFQLSLDHAHICHEHFGIKDQVVSKLTMLAVQNFEVMYEKGNKGTDLSEGVLLSVTNVDGCWNPDIHLFYYDVSMQLAILGGRFSGKSKENRTNLPGERLDTAVTMKDNKDKQKIRLAVDVEKLDFTAKVTKEIDFALHIQSLVSEDVEIGLLVENVQLVFNDAKVLCLEQAQICRLPFSSPEGGVGTTDVGKKVDWKVSIHATKIHIIMPFRLQLRVIEDAVEDMWRVLKLTMRAHKSKWKPLSVILDQNKVRKPSAQIHSILGSVLELTFEIEEEPLQGWLDEHHHLMAAEVCKLRVQERILEEKHQEAVKNGFGTKSNPVSRTGFHYSTSQMLNSEWLSMQKDAFNAYRRACERLVVHEGSGACKVGLQSGFRLSKKRRSLLRVCASGVEMSLGLVKGSMLDVIRMLDCVDSGIQVPFAKVYGRHLSIQASALVAQLRDFTSPLIETGMLECEGNVVIAQQARTFPLQMRQNVNLGQLRTVEVWRSISGATPAYKTFLDLDVQVDTGNISFGVGYEPVMADVSYAFTIALQKAKPAVPVVKKERSLPWWDDMRYYIHGRNSLKVKNFTWSLLATTNPYELQQQLQFVATTMDIRQSEGSVILMADELEWVICRRVSAYQSHLLADYEEKLSVLHTPRFKLEIAMDWKWV